MLRGRGAASRLHSEVHGRTSDERDVYNVPRCRVALQDWGQEAVGADNQCKSQVRV